MMDDGEKKNSLRLQGRWMKGRRWKWEEAEEWRSI